MFKSILLIIILLFANDSNARDSQVEITQVIDLYHQAASDANYDDYFSTMDESAIILGTDGSERWTKETFKNYVQPYFKKGIGWTYKVQDRNLTIVKENEIVFFDELLKNDKYGYCRGSGVLKNTVNGWKILQYNLTFVVPNDAAKAVVSTINNHE